MPDEPIVDEAAAIDEVIAAAEQVDYSRENYVIGGSSTATGRSYHGRNLTEVADAVARGLFRAPMRVAMRRLLSGGRKPADVDAPVWPVARAPQPTGGAAADPDHPSRKHDQPDLEPTRTFVPIWSGISPRRRRDRRPEMIARDKQERRARLGR